MPEQRIARDDDSELDDVWLSNVDVHIERMTDAGYFIGIYRGDEVFLLDAKKVRTTFETSGWFS